MAWRRVTMGEARAILRQAVADAGSHEAWALDAGLEHASSVSRGLRGRRLSPTLLAILGLHVVEPEPDLEPPPAPVAVPAYREVAVDRGELVRRVAGGATQAQLARSYGVSVGRMRDIMRKLGVAPRGQVGSGPLAGRDDEIVAMRVQGFSYSEIARRYGVSGVAVFQVCKRHGLAGPNARRAA